MTTPEKSSRGARGPADVVEVDALLGEAYPGARTELDHRDAFELLVATVLSAQTTDVRVNSLTPELFSRWPDAAALAGADEEQAAALLRPLGMGGTRAARIIGLAQGLLRDHGGRVPDDQEALEALPGVGRKTAYVVRGTWFGHSLLAVDTHVARLSRRLGWTRSKDPVKVETDVVSLVEQAEAGARGDGDDGEIDLTALHLRLILHGRRVCLARAPQCGTCVLAGICPSAEVA